MFGTLIEVNKILKDYTGVDMFMDLNYSIKDVLGVLSVLWHVITEDDKKKISLIFAGKRKGNHIIFKEYMDRYSK